MTSSLGSSYQNVQTEPAFITNEKYITSRPRGYHKSLSDCCYSISNLALIVACVIALVFLIKFLQDDPLYEYGEHLLSLRFYRQLIYIVVIIPLALLVPVFNAASGFFLHGLDKRDLGTVLLRLKIFYQLLVGVLVFVALTFVAPNIRFNGVASQIESQLRGHMQMRYENPFSYELMDRLQEEYQCCDEIWYRANYMDKLPMSCYQQDGRFEAIWRQTCPVVIGSMISNWCSIIAACLVAVLVALAVLVGIDILHLLTYSSGQYDVDVRETSQTASGSARNGTPPTGRRSADHHSDDEDTSMVDDVAARLRLEERERTMPLLSQAGREAAEVARRHQQRQSASEDNESPLLTRVNYLPSNRAQSPVFVNGNLRGSQTSLGQSPTRGVLKKGPSSQRVDSDDEASDADYHEHQRRIQRDIQTRRSLLNVRFADD